jgi:hypothetical protein
MIRILMVTMCATFGAITSRARHAGHETIKGLENVDLYRMIVVEEPQEHPTSRALARTPPYVGWCLFEFACQRRGAGGQINMQDFCGIAKRPIYLPITIYLRHDSKRFLFG